MIEPTGRGKRRSELPHRCRDRQAVHGCEARAALKRDDEPDADDRQQRVDERYVDLPALIFGVAFGNVILGVPFKFDDTLRMTYEGGLFGLLNPFALLSGLISVAMLTLLSLVPFAPPWWWALVAGAGMGLPLASTP